MRRRLREQRRLREALLLDLGALVYELHRQGKRAPELLQQKAAELTVVDEEVRELEAALDGREAPAGAATEVEATAGEDREDEDAFDEEPAGELREEDELGEDEPGEEGEPDEDEPGSHEQLEDAEAEDDGRDGDETHEQPAVPGHEEPRP